VEALAAGQSGVAAYGIEPVIGYLKNDGRFGHMFLKDRDGDRINAFLADAGYNTHLVFKWLGHLLARIVVVIRALH
jgi:IS5 family transposase